jgi:hypothetical protein
MGTMLLDGERLTLEDVERVARPAEGRFVLKGRPHSGQEISCRLDQPVPDPGQAARPPRHHITVPPLTHQSWPVM